jgi:transposase InsO family protein
MDQTLKEQIAAFRYSLIAPIVSRQTPLEPGELKAILQETASRTYHIPGSHKQTVSVRTLERYLEDYRKAGWDGLKPRGRKDLGYTQIAPAVLQKTMELRKERPERSVEQIIFLLEEGGVAERETLAASTLARHLRKAGLSRRDLLKEPSRGHRRFEAEDILRLWQFDFKHFVYLPDPTHPKKKRKTVLFAILDDYSRYIVHAQFYWDEKLPRMEDSLKKAILRHGIPEQFYCDNGAAFSSHHLARICGRLAIRLTHSRPYRPQGRGKVERFFQFVDTSFRPEVFLMIERGELTTLEQLNDALWAWLDGYYHEREHGSTGMSPRQRFMSSSRERKRRSLVELNEIFLWEETRTVDKTGCVSLMGNTYEVQSGLEGGKVQLRYDPFDLSHVQVWQDGKRLSDAKPMETVRRLDRRISQNNTGFVEETDGQLSFLDLAQQRREATWQNEGLQFAPGDDKE